MTKVSELVSQNVGNAIINSQTWGGILLNVKVFGAVGNGVADDTLAIQATINDAIAKNGIVYLPAGVYLVTAKLTINKSIRMMGGGRSLSVIVSLMNDTVIEINTNLGDIYYSEFSEFGIEVGGAGAKTSSVGIRITGANSFRRSTIHNIHFRGTYTGIKVDTTKVTDWITYTELLFDNQASPNNIQYAMYIATGGTGNIYSNLSILTVFAGLYFYGPSIGDTTILGIHCEGGTYSIYCENITPFTYGARFNITGCKFDSVTQPVTMKHIDNFKVIGNTYVGGILHPVSVDAFCSEYIIDDYFNMSIKSSSEILIDVTPPTITATNGTISGTPTWAYYKKSFNGKMCRIVGRVTIAFSVLPTVGEGFYFIPPHIARSDIYQLGKALMTSNNATLCQIQTNQCFILGNVGNGTCNFDITYEAQ